VIVLIGERRRGGKSHAIEVVVHGLWGEKKKQKIAKKKKNE
jgi:ribonuclease I